MAATTRPWLRTLHRHRHLIYLPALGLIALAAAFADFIFLFLGWLLLFVPLSLHFALARRRTTFLRRRLVFRSEGKWYVGITLAIGLAAMNTGTNLLYLILGMLLSLILVSGVLSEWSFRRLRLTRRHAPTVFAGEPLAVCLEVENKKRIIPAIAVRVDEPAPELEAESPCAVALKIAPGETVRLRYSLRFARRGPRQLERCDLSSSFPFGFFDKILSLRVESELLVFPRIRPLSPAFTDALHDRNARSESGSSMGRGLEFRGIREYRPGDERKHIHWRSSARLGQLRTRVFEGSRTPRVAVLFEACAPDLAPPAFEELVEAAASVCAFLDRSGFELSFSSGGLSVESGRGLDEIYAHLARVEPAPVPLARDHVHGVPGLSRSQAWVVVGAGEPCQALAEGLRAEGHARPVVLDLTRGSPFTDEPSGGSA